MRILITNSHLTLRSGTETYVFDLALALAQRGHDAAVFVLHAGPYAEELKSRGISVVTDLNQMQFMPDILHCHGHQSTLTALKYYRSTPAIFICHNHRYWIDTTPLHSHIMRYFGVSQLCVDRIVREGIARPDVTLLLNWVDTERFARRQALPERPQRALMFSNYASDLNYLPAIRQACTQAGLLLDIAGIGNGNPITNPEHILPQYDFVFAKAKAAMEAMSVGNAVVLCDFGGVGPMVSPENFSRLLPMNFGFQALTQPITPDALLTQIAAYSAQRSARVCDLIRQTSSIQTRVDEIEAVYFDVIAEFASGAVTIYRPRLSDHIRTTRNALKRASIWAWEKLPASIRKQIKSHHNMRALLRILNPY